MTILGVSFGFDWNISAAVSATIGVDIEVPDIFIIVTSELPDVVGRNFKTGLSATIKEFLPAADRGIARECLAQLKPT